MKPRVEALINQITSGKLQTDISRILHHIKSFPYSTLPEIERKLSLKHETASARVSDLLDMGLIEEQGVKKSPIGHYTYFKYQPNFHKQKVNAMGRKQLKYDQWVKKGLTQFDEFINPELKELLTH